MKNIKHSVLASKGKFMLMCESIFAMINHVAFISYFITVGNNNHILIIEEQSQTFTKK